MKKKRDVLVYLEDISVSCGLISTYISGISEGVFYTSPEKQDALLRRIQIIGEAAKHVPQDFREKWSEIPWKEKHPCPGLEGVERGKTIEKFDLFMLISIISIIFSLFLCLNP